MQPSVNKAAMRTAADQDEMKLGVASAQSQHIASSSAASVAVVRQRGQSLPKVVDIPAHWKHIYYFLIPFCSIV